MLRFIMTLLEAVPLSPWWFARKRRRASQQWIRHLARYHATSDQPN